MRAFLKRNNELIGWTSGIGIPLALVFTGWLAVNSVENSKLDSEYVKISLNILSAKLSVKSENGNPPQWTRDELALREWAVRLLNAKSPEKFSPEEQKALLNATIDLASDDSRKNASGPIVFGQTVVVQSSSADGPAPVELNIAQPYSREYPASDLLVTVTEIPDLKIARLLKENGTQISEGAVINVADLRALRLQDRTQGSGGTSRIRYVVGDPLHRIGEATIQIVINPVVTSK